jgi:hypothetical protein
MSGGAVNARPAAFAIAVGRPKAQVPPLLMGYMGRTTFSF